MKQKKIVILGDSYSTFAGHIPEGYVTYYPDELGSGVDDVTKTWWHRLAVDTDSEIIENNSWSGSTVGYTGYGGGDCSKSSSFIYRLRCLKEHGVLDSADTMFIFGITNDFWAQVPLGEMMLEDTAEEDLYKVLPTICHITKAARDYLSHGRVYWIVNVDLCPEINDAIIDACAHYGVGCIRLHDIDMINSHPTAVGMEAICQQVMEAVE